MTTEAEFRPWRRAATALLTAFVLVALAVYFAAAWQAYRHPLEASPWNERWAVVTVAACAAIGALLLAGKSRLAAWSAVGSVLALLVAVALLGGAATALLAFAWVALIALAAGDAILALVAGDVSWEAMERALYAWLVGFAAVGFAVFGIALGGWLYREVALGLLVAASAAAVVWWGRRARGARLAHGLAAEWRGLFGAQPVPSACVVAAVCVSMLGTIVWSVAPEIRTDALVYQLAVPRAYVDRHGLVNLPGNFRSYWVGLANMPSTLGLLLAGQPLPQLFVLFQGVLLAWQGLVLFAWLGGARAGLLAAGLIATTPYLLRLESTTMTDVPAAVLAFGAVSAATRWWGDRRRGWLTIFGVLAGSAISARGNTAFVLLPALVVVGWGLFRWERDRAASGLARLLAPMAATASPWLLLRWHWTGNPVFPLLNERFPNPLWGQGPARLDWDDFGLGSGLGDFLRLPWDLTVESGAFAGTGAPPGVYGVAVLLAVPLFLPFLSRQERQRWMPLLLTAGVGVVVWFLNTPYARYALPLLPILCGLSAMNVVAGYAAARNRLPSGRLLPASALLAVAYLGATRLVATASVIREPELYPVSVAFGREAPDAFLARHLAEMPALAAMRANGGGDVLSLGMPRGLYYDGTLTEALDFSPRFRYLLEIEDAETLLAELRELGAAYVLVDWSSATRFLTEASPFAGSDGAEPREGSSVPLLLSHSRFLDPFLDDVFTGNGLSVFAVRESPVIADSPATHPREETRCRGSAALEERGRSRGRRQPCIAVAPEPVLAGLGRGGAMVDWSSGAMRDGELVLAIDGTTEIPLDAGRGGAYRLRQLEPGFDYAVRLYATDEHGRTLVAESPLRVWAD